MARLPDNWMDLSPNQQSEYLRSLRYRTARQWAARISRERLEHIVALFVAQNRPGATKSRTRQGHESARSFAREAVTIWSIAQELHASNRKLAAEPDRIAYLLAPFIAALPKGLRKRDARMRAAAMLKKNPKQLAKVQARQMFDDWKDGKLKYRSAAAFARAVCAATVIENTKTVEHWATQWNRERAKQRK